MSFLDRILFVYKVKNIGFFYTEPVAKRYHGKAAGPVNKPHEEKEFRRKGFEYRKGGN